MKFELIVLNELRLKKPVVIASTMLLLIRNIIGDELVHVVKEDKAMWEGPLGGSYIDLTEKGQKFVEEWIGANKELTY
jgi:hypothetical protein